MATYGQFETRSQLAIGEATVFAAARGGDERFVIKAIEADESVEGPDVARARTRRFLDRAETMRTLTESGRAANWIELLEAGEAESGAYYATRRYENSVRKLVRGRVSLDGARLYHVISGAFEGLTQIRDVAGRAHGALKADNVLLDRVGEVQRARVLLADPAPSEDVGPQTGESEDVQALGRLIYELVFFEAFRLPGGWPVEDAPQWRRLGETAGQWRALCNRVLDPNADPAGLTLDSIADDIKGLRTAGGAPRQRGGVPTGVKVGAAAMALLLAGGLGAHLAGLTGALLGGGGSGTTPIPEDDSSATAERWRRWCLASSAWLGDVSRELETSRELIQSDPFLSERLGDLTARLAEGELELDPLDATTLAYFDSRELADELPEDVDPALVTRANEAIDRIASALREWPARDEARDAAESFRALGWTRTAERLDRWATAASDPTAEHELDFADAMRYLLESRATLEQLAAHAGQASEVIDRLSETGLAPREALASFLREAEGPASGSGPATLGRLETAARQRLAILTELASAIEAAFDERVPEHVRRAFLEEAEGSGLSPSEPAYYQRYQIVLNDPPAAPTRRIEDPNPDWRRRLTSGLARAGERIDAMRARAGLLDQEQSRLADLEERAERIRADLDELPGELTEENLDRVLARRDGLDSRLSDVSGDLGAIEESLAQRTQSRQDLIDEIREQASITPPDAAFAETLDEAWRARRTAVIERGGTSAERLRTERSRLRDALLSVESAVRATPAAPDATDRIDGAALDEAARQRRRRAVEGMIEALPEAPGEPGWSGFDASATEAARAYTEWVDRVESALESVRWIEARIEAGHALDEAISGTDSIASVMGELEAEANRTGIGAAINPLAQFVERVREAGATTSWTEALATVKTRISEPPIALAAWRSLDPAEAPAPSQQLVDALVSADGLLRAAIDRMEGADRADRLRREIEASRARCAAGLLEAAATPAQLALILDQQQLEVDLASEPAASIVSDRVRYNVLVRELVADLDSAAEQDVGAAAVAERVDAFAARVERLDVGLPEPARAWIAELEGLDEASTVDRRVLEQRGPGAVGWTISAFDGERVVYTGPPNSTEPRSIEFVKLSGIGGSDQAHFLSTTEVSVGLLAAVVERADAWSDLASVWSDLEEALEDPRSAWAGPRTWQWNGRTLVPGVHWFANAIGDAVLDRSIFPEAVRPPEPAWAHPIQRISGRAAIEFAALLDCELPTAAQWRAGLAMERDASGEATWNLRGGPDDVWARHKRHLDENWDQAEARTPYYLDFKAFTPGEVNGQAIPTGDAARPDPSGEDGSLLFEPVEPEGGRGAIFKHIIGNVAEFVRTPSDGSPGVGVIGRSALSSPRLEPDEPYVPSGFLARRDPSAWIFADVGFRLAFRAEARAADFAQRLEDARRRSDEAYAF